jgi:hypothetical protein
MFDKVYILCQLWNATHYFFYVGLFIFHWLLYMSCLSNRAPLLCPALCQAPGAYSLISCFYFRHISLFFENNYDF